MLEHGKRSKKQENRGKRHKDAPEISRGSLLSMMFGQRHGTALDGFIPKDHEEMLGR